jgi:hypothetical protein
MRMTKITMTMMAITSFSFVMVVAVSLAQLSERRKGEGPRDGPVEVDVGWID